MGDFEDGIIEFLKTITQEVFGPFTKGLSPDVKLRLGIKMGQVLKRELRYVRTG